MQPLLEQQQPPVAERADRPLVEIVVPVHNE
jgi:hypothetical protein